MRITTSKIFFFCSCSFLIGIACDEKMSISISPFFFLFPSCIFFVLATIWKHSAIAIASLLAFSIFFLGFFRFSIDDMSRNSHRIIYESIKEKHPYDITGKIISEPQEKFGNFQYMVGDIKIGAEHVPGNILITFPRVYSFAYGDIVNTSTSFQKPKNFDAFREYTTYLELSQVYALADSTHAKVIGRASWWSPKKIIFSAKHSVEKHIQRILPEPHASFLAAMLLGSRNSIPKDLNEAFKRTGLTHIIAVSGFNITLVGHTVELILHRVIKRTHAYWMIVGAIGVFVVMTGAQASVIRAGLMTVISLTAIQLGRRGNVLNALLLAACLMAALQPLVLLHDIGFQLSFAATVGIIWVSPLIETYFLRIPQLFQMRETLTLSSAAQLTTLPVSLIHFGGISVIAPVANILVLPLIPFIMLIGSINILISYIYAPIAQVLGFVPWIVLQYELWIISVCAHLPIAYIGTKPIPLIALCCWYIGLTIFFLIKSHGAHIARIKKAAHN